MHKMGAQVKWVNFVDFHFFLQQTKGWRVVWKSIGATQVCTWREYWNMTTVFPELLCLLQLCKNRIWCLTKRHGAGNFQRQTLFLKNKDHMKVSKLKLEVVKTVNFEKFYYLKPSRILLLHSHHFVTFLCPRNKNVSTQGWLYANIINSWFFHSKFEMTLFMQNQFFKWWQKNWQNCYNNER